jgi:hypothetical protein
MHQRLRPNVELRSQLSAHLDLPALAADLAGVTANRTRRLPAGLPIADRDRLNSLNFLTIDNSSQ